MGSVLLVVDVKVIAMPIRTGLYYPYIHVRSDDWLKASALYWREMARIAPRRYPIRDSYTAQVFADSGYLTTADPTPASYPVGKAFGELVQANGAQLRAAFVVTADQVHQALDLWDEPSLQRRVGFIHRGKVDPDLVDLLVEEGLSTGIHPRGHGWIPMHQTLANAYMTAIGRHMTQNRHAALVTDSAGAFDAVEQRSFEAVLAEISKSSHPMPTTRSRLPEFQLRVARLAIETVVPRGLAGVDAARIVDFREKHTDLLGAFREEVEKVARQLEDWPEGGDESALRDQISDVTKQGITKRVDDLEKALKLFGLSSIRQALTLQSGVVPTAVAGAGVTAGASPGHTAALGALAFGLTFVSFNAHRRQELLNAQPASNYLLQIRKQLG